MGSTRGRGKRTTTRGDSGATLVEFAIILPVFAMLLLGMFSAGIALNDKQELTHAIREGARYGATIPASEFSGNTFATVIRDEVIDRSGGLLSAGEICVSVVRGTPDAAAQESANGLSSGSVKTLEVVSSTNGSACDPSETYPLPTEDGDTGQRIQVRAQRPTKIELGVFGAYTITIDESATAKSEYDS